MLVSPSPHIHANVSTRSLMLDVIIALTPAIVVSVLFYGWSELMILAVSVASRVGYHQIYAQGAEHHRRFVSRGYRSFAGYELAKHHAVVGCVHRRTGVHRGGQDDFRRNWPESF